MIYLKNYGAVAQLGEYLHGMQGVEGSNPSSSTKHFINEMFGGCRINVIRPPHKMLRH